MDNLQKALKRIRKVRKSKVLLVVDGREGSGTSEFAKKLCEALGDCIIIDYDNFKVGEPDMFAKEYIDSGFRFRFEEREYNFDDLKEMFVNAEQKYIIIEGTFSMKIKSLFAPDIMIWLEVDKNKTKEKLLTRERSNSARENLSEETLQLGIKKWQEAEDRYILNARAYEISDLILQEEKKHTDFRLGL